MPTPDRREEADISAQLEALARERIALRSARSKGEIEPAEFTKAMSKNSFLEAQIQEQHQNEATRDKSRDAEKERGRGRDLFGD